MTARRFSATFITILTLIFATPLFAQETQVDASAEASGSVSPLQLPTRPLDILKTRAQQVKDQTLKAQEAVQLETRVRLQADPPTGNRAPDARQSSSTNAQGPAALVRMHGGEIKNRFSLAIRHLRSLLGRIETRLEKMASQGADTTSVESKMDEAEAAIVKAEADIQAVASFVAGVSAESDHAAVRAELQVKIKTAHESLKAAHKAVLDTVRALVSLGKNINLNTQGTTSASTSVE